MVEKSFLMFCIVFCKYFPEKYSEPYQTSRMDLCAKIVNDFQRLTVFTKGSILDV